MPIDDLSTWQTTMADIPKVSDNSWATNFSNWTDERVTGKAQLTGVITTNFPFSFNKTIFKNSLLTISSSVDVLIAANNFASVWETAILASLFLNVMPGDNFGVPTPATIWSSITSSLIDIPSISVAKALLIAGLTGSSPVSDPLDSVFPEAFRSAFLSLTGTVTGLNSLPPPSGPQPLIVASVSLL